MRTLLALLAIAVCAGLFGSTAYAQTVPAPVITSPAPGATLTSNTITVTGTSVSGYTIIVGDPALNVLGSTIVDSNGDWSVDIQLQDGTHTIIAAAFPNPADLSTRGVSSPLVITVQGGGTPAPDPSTVTTIISPTHGTIITGSTVAMHGAAPPNTDITILDLTGTSVATAASDGNGMWSAVFSRSDGMHTFVAAAVTDDGIPTPNRDSVTIFVTDGVTPSADHPVVTSPVSGASVPDNTFTVTGTSAPGNAITIVDLFAKEVGNSVADASGAWSVEVTDADGVHFFFAISRGEGTTPLYSDPFLVYVSLGDGPAPGELPPPTITSPANGALIADGGGVQITGTAAPNAVVRVTGLDIAPIGTTHADGTGSWSMTADLEDGLHTLAATSERGGQTSGHSLILLVYVDSGAAIQDRPVITNLPTTAVYADGTVTISGTAVPNSPVAIINYMTPIATTASDGGGAWSITTEVPNGLHIISAIVSTADGTARSGNSVPVLLFINEPADTQRTLVCR